MGCTILFRYLLDDGRRLLNDFLKKTAVGGAIITLFGILAWKLFFILVGIVTLIAFAGIAYGLGDLFFLDDDYHDR